MIRLIDAEHIGPAIADLRILYGISQRTLAADAGTWQSMICHWEKGQRLPDIGSLFKVVNALDYDLALVPRVTAVPRLADIPTDNRRPS